MSKDSKRRFQRLGQSGIGRRSSVVYRLPRLGGRVPAAPVLSDQARFRLRCIEHVHRAGVAAAMEVFGVSRATVYRLRKRDNPNDLTS